MHILAIETSCDETAVSVVQATGEFTAPRFSVLAHLVSSQVKLHEPFGGVVPSLAKREHARNLVPLLQEALAKAGLLMKRENAEKLAPELHHKLQHTLAREPELLEQLVPFLEENSVPKIDAVAVTRGPGLEPALWVGLNLARALATAWSVKIAAIDHMEGHFLSPLVSQQITTQNYNTLFPALALLISGGHTELVLSKNWLEYQKLGETRDDAVGEAFDKVARILNLPYPGGPEIGKLATQAEQENLPALEHKLPRPMLSSPDLDFSFSGLKTAVLYLVKNLGEIDENKKKQIAREFQQAVIDVLLSKTSKAITQYNPKTLIIAGGVSANQELQTQFRNKLAPDFSNLNLLIPDLKLSTDNATMIAVAGYFRALKNDFADPEKLTADGNLNIDSR